MPPIPSQSHKSPPVYPWKRFWRLWNQPINCGDDGKRFLQDPKDEFARALNPNVRPIDEFVPTTGLLVLCGDPGMGKTTEFKKLRDTFASAPTLGQLIALNFREDIDSMATFRLLTTQSQMWQSWKNGTDRLTLMIDAIDEGLIHIPQFVSLLCGCLKSEPTDRLRLILTCRSAEWPEAQGQSLASLWIREEQSPDPRIELCPLRYRDIETAAETLHLDSDRFGEELWRAQAVGLATRPVTLEMLLHEFKNHGALPDSCRELYKRGTRRLANEVDPQRLEILRAKRPSPNSTGEQRLAASHRMAALLLCCAKSVLHRDHPNQEDHTSKLPISDCVGETDLPDIAYEDAIESGLFTAAGSGFAFAHPTFAECLAADELGRLPLTQVRRLLMRRDAQGEHVVPQLIELAAWTAGTHSEFCNHLLSTDPATLLRCDVSILPEDMRARIVQALLDGAADGSIPDDYTLYRFFHTLNHPGLASQLRPLIKDKSIRADARRISIEIIEACRLSEFTDDLFKLVADHDDPARKQAAEALCKIIPCERLAELEPLAKGEAGPDHDQSMRAAALRRLVPSHWSVAQALPFLVRKAQNNFIGTYHMVLEDYLPRFLTNDDLPACLNWLQSNEGAFDSLSSRNKLTAKTIELSFEHLEIYSVGAALTKLWIHLAQKHLVSILTERFGIRDRLAKDDEKRRYLIAMLLNGCVEQHCQVWPMFVFFRGIETAADFEWLLDRLPEQRSESQPVWIEFIAGHSWAERLVAPHWDKLSKLRQDFPTLETRLSWLKAWSLDDPIARKAKAKWLRDRRLRARLDKLDRRHHFDPKPRRDILLERGRRSDPDAWFGLWKILRYDDQPGEIDHGFRLETEKFHGWKLLNADEQAVARSAASLFLTHYADESSTWEPGCDGGLASTSALWLLRDELLSDPMLLSTATKWIRLFSAFGDTTDAGPSTLFSILYQIDRNEAIAALVHATDKRLMKGSYALSLRVAKSCWDQHCNDAMRKLLGESRHFIHVADGIEGWSEMDRAAASAFATEQITSALPDANPAVTYPANLKGLLIQALLLSPVTTFGQAKTLLGADRKLVQSIWPAVLHETGVRNEKWLDAWTEPELANLYLHLLDVFPATEDPRDEDGLISPRTSAGWARDRIPSQIAERATRTACRVLWELTQVAPKHAELLRWYHRNAVTQCRRNEWSPPSPKEVRQMIENSAARLIASEEDLLDLVIESLQRFQYHLTGRSNPAVRTLWNETREEGTKRIGISPKNEKALQAEVARWIEDDLGKARGLAVNCEVEPRLGSFTDVWIEAHRPSNRDDFEKMVVVIEIKGCWHAEVRSAMHHQLVEKYLRPNSLMAGIYLIGWFVCDVADVDNKTGCQTLHHARGWLDRELRRYDGTAEPERVWGVILDCSYPRL